MISLCLHREIFLWGFGRDQDCHFEEGSDSVSMQILNYPGAKFRLAPWLISQFPPHDVYAEPF